MRVKLKIGIRARPELLDNAASFIIFHVPRSLRSVAWVITSCVCAGHRSSRSNSSKMPTASSTSIDNDSRVPSAPRPLRLVPGAVLPFAHWFCHIRRHLPGVEIRIPRRMRNQFYCNCAGYHSHWPTNVCCTGCTCILRGAITVEIATILARLGAGHKLPLLPSKSAGRGTMIARDFVIALLSAADMLKPLRDSAELLNWTAKSAAWSDIPRFRHLVEPFEDAGGNAGRLLVEPAREIT